MAQVPSPGEGRAAEQGLHPAGHRGVRQGAEGGPGQTPPARGEAQVPGVPAQEAAANTPGEPLSPLPPAISITDQQAHTFHILINSINMEWNTTAVIKHENLELQL